MQNRSILINKILKSHGDTFPFIKNIILILFGTLLLAVSSKVQVPFWPVPMTMQTFVVFLIGMTYGWKLASITLLFYLIEGAMGIPVFAKGGGLTYLIGPTAGYLYGMFFAAFVIGILSEKGYANSYLLCLVALLIGSIIIFALGIGYLGTVIGYEKAIVAGLIPFIPSELFKIILAVLIIPSLSKNFN